ncbi:phage capsid protein [Enterococcus avium]|uniref:phage capsid protein n=1 Tax=Enterococcus avium TaxID=33945 RepID=UPI001C10CA16|nr:phage capsid protein [Enterococcus avium]MBU5370532.1 phage capsid protein [Enterococcus avium]
MKSPQQIVFDELFKLSLDLGYETYDDKPLSNAKYPFVEFEYAQQIESSIKLARKGIVPISFSVWGSQKKRNEVSTMAGSLFDAALKGFSKEGYFFTLNRSVSSITIQTDTSTNTKLYRGLIELEFQFIS